MNHSARGVVGHSPRAQSDPAHPDATVNTDPPMPAYFKDGKVVCFLQSAAEVQAEVRDVGRGPRIRSLYPHIDHIHSREART
jgi:hypothetical protein